jgi:hypothetical protein
MLLSNGQPVHDDYSPSKHRTACVPATRATLAHGAEHDYSTGWGSRYQSADGARCIIVKLQSAESGLPDEAGDDDTVDNTKYLTHDPRPAGKQESAAGDRRWVISLAGFVVLCGQQRRTIRVTSGALTTRG